MSKQKINLKDITISALFTALIAVMSQIMIPIPGGVPLTLQTFSVALAGYFLKVKHSAFCIFVYILLGIVGVPVFSGFKGGIQVLFGPTGGFIFGFIFLTVLCGAEVFFKHKALKILIGIAGLVICHILGIIQFSLVYKTGFIASSLTVSVPYIIKDIISVVLAYLIAEKLRRRLPEKI